MSIPLVQSNNVNDINTSLIAIRRELNNNSGSSSMSDVNVNVDVNYNVADVIESGNSLPVTSNAVADALSYSTTEVNTGKKWIDGKTIYSRVIMCTTALTFTPNQWTSLVSFANSIFAFIKVSITAIKPVIPLK